MTALTLILLIHGGQPLTRFEVILIAFFIGFVMFASILQAILKTWIERIRGRKWPTSTANVDIVSVADVTDDQRLPSYLATLTYAYHTPEKQLGEYSRRFGNKGDAEAWANSYKGEAIKIHVNPRDPPRLRTAR